MEQTEVRPRGGYRLVLGFDAGCMACRSVASVVTEAADGKLEVRSLHDQQIKRWREQALGEDAPWVPTLFEVDGVREVRTWTGARMALKLTCALGPISTLRVIQAILVARNANSVDSLASPVADNPPSYGINRGQFIKRLGTGALAAGFAATGFGAFSSRAAAGAIGTSTHASRGGFTTVAERRQFNRAIEILAHHLRVSSNGTLQVSDARVSEAIEAGKEEGIPRRIFQELTSSLDVANEQILEGNLSGGSKLISPGVQEVTEQESLSKDLGSTSGRNATRACRGKSSRSVHWWGIRMRLNSCQANTLIYYCTIEAGAATLCSRIWIIPCKIAAFVLLVQCATYQRAAAPGRGIVIDKSWGFRLPRVYSQ